MVRDARRKRPTHGKSTSTTATDVSDEAGDEAPLFFYMPNEKYGEFCQWYPSFFIVDSAEIGRLVEREGEQDEGNDTPVSNSCVTFGCAEQFRMYCKSLRFDDMQTAARVMGTNSPKEQKRLGRLTDGFTAESWDKVKSAVAQAGNMAKFGQNASLGRKLLATGDRLLVEAASRDRIWGIGYTAKHAMQHRQHWGENRLGKALMAVRGCLQAEEERQRKEAASNENAG